jgi:hypothetical protein
VIDWLFRNRQTGRITVAQVPNLPLVVALAALGARRLFAPSGAWDGTLGFVGWVALGWWAVGEVFRGVNPFRRLLGGGVLLAGILLAVRSG